MECPFCLAVADPASPVVLSRGLSCAVLADRFPVAPGHVLVVPVRHVGRLVDLRASERFELMSAVFDRAALMQSECDALTVGVNDGPAAGQTIPHVHVHLIPRHAGDVPDARGGVRMLFPAGRYWE